MITQTAEKKKIAFQRQAVSRSTGTDTDSFAYSAEGVASALISLPLKYMHTTVETVHKADVESVINLIYEVLLQVKPNFDYRYIR
jgi:putative aminopeptidase FrvX